MKTVKVLAAAFALSGMVAYNASAQTTQQGQRTQGQSAQAGKEKITQAELPQAVQNTLKAEAFKAWTIDEVYRVSATAQAGGTATTAGTTTTGTTTTGTTAGTTSGTTAGTTSGTTTVGTTSGTTTSGMTTGTTTGTTSGTTAGTTTSGTTAGGATTTGTTAGTQTTGAYTYEVIFRNAEGKGAIARFNEDGSIIRSKDKQ